MPNPVCCPRCGQSDAIQKVAGIVATQGSPLAYELQAAPPPGWQPIQPLPERRGWPVWTWVLLALSVPLDAILLIALLVLAALVAAAILAVLTVAALGYLVWRVLSRHRRVRRNLRERHRRELDYRRWNHAYQWWSQLEYCYRCHGVFLPGNDWQYAEVTVRRALAPPVHSWALACQLAEYADRYHGAAS